MAKPRKKRVFPLLAEADLIPVLSCMFLLIPALLLAMEVASFAAVPVVPPKMSTTGNPDARAQDLTFRVEVRSDGYAVSVKGRSSAAQETIIGLAGGELDNAALSELAAETKALFPEETTVTLTAEGDVPLQDLVAAMDAVRGEDCSLLEVHHSEEPPPGCLFWNVAVDGT